MSDTVWYFVENGERAGPVRAAELQDMADHGMIAPDTLVWSDGMADWVAAGQKFDFGAGQGAMDAATPPIPARAAVVDDMGFPLTSATAGWAQVVSDGGIGADGLYVGAPSRGFGEAISVCFGKYATFSGRASRSEYWFFFLFTFLLNITVGLIPFVGMILALGLLLPSLAASVRRLHDTDRSGWWIGGFYLAIPVLGVVTALVAESSVYGRNGEGAFALLGIFGIVFLIYGILLLVFTCQRGTPGPNRFG